MTTHITNPPAEEQLVPVFTAKIGDTVTQACDARALHTYLQNGDLFANWIKARISKYQFVENQDFICVLENTKTQRKDGQKGFNSYLTNYSYLLHTIHYG